MKLKWALIGFGVAAIIFILAGYLGYRYFISGLIPALEIPLELKVPRVVLGSSVVSKTTFAQEPRLGPITDILVMQKKASHEITVAGSHGAITLENDGRIISTVMFSGRAGRVQIIDVDHDGLFEYVNRGEWAIDPSLIDHNGNTVWSYGSGVDDMAPGDIDGDGVLEYAVGFNGSGGVHLLDKGGKLLWKQPDGNVWHVEIVDTNGDGRGEVVHSNAAGFLIIRDHNGRIVQQAQPNPYISWFSLTRWPRQAPQAHLILSADGTVWILDFDGKTVTQFPAPLSVQVGGSAKGVSIRYGGSKSDYFAALVTFNHWGKSILYIYEPTGALMYQEILDGRGSAIAALPKINTENESLLVGGEGAVWQYKLKEAD